MSKKRIFVLGTALLIGFVLTSCAGYYAGYGYRDYPYGYGYHNYPYYENPYGYFLYPSFPWHERWEHHHGSKGHHDR